MATSSHDADTHGRTLKLLTAGAEAELRLLRSERKAEKRLAEAIASLVSDETRLHRAQQRLERSRESLAAAGFSIEDLRDAPDRPGRENVFFARRS